MTCSCPYLRALRAKIAAGHGDECECLLCTDVRRMQLKDLQFFVGADEDERKRSRPNCEEEIK